MLPITTLLIALCVAKACNPLCKGTGHDPGEEIPQNTYQDAEEHKYFPVGSLYVMPGCTFTGYEGHNYFYDPKVFEGSKSVYKVPDTRVGPTQHVGCPTGFRSYKCTCIQKSINCKPSDSYEVVEVCDNRASKVPVECTYTKQVGTQYTKSIEKSMSVSTTVQNQLQLDMKFLMDILGMSKNTQYDWKTSKSQTFQDMVSYEIKAPVPPGVSLTISQVVGYCGPNKIYTPQFVFTSVNKRLLKKWLYTMKMRAPKVKFNMKKVMAKFTKVATFTADWTENELAHIKKQM